MDDDETFILAGFQILLGTLAVALHLCQVQQEEANRVRRRWWVRPAAQQRQLTGFFEKTFWLMYFHDKEQFKNWARMTVEQFDYLAKLIEPLVGKQTTQREPLSVEERLAVTLQYLNHGSTPLEIALNFARGRSTVSMVVPEVCNAIWKALKPLYLKPPSSPEEWTKIADDFFNDWNLPNCLSAIDGKHVSIKAPKKTGSKYFNYKKTFSINLMAACDSKYRFTLVDIGSYGSNADSFVFESSPFGRAIVNDEVNTPLSRPLPGTAENHPYFFIGDNGFGLKKNLVTPFCKRNKDSGRECHQIFNYRISRARRTIENCFGILTQRFLIYQKTLQCSKDTAISIVKATVALHNMLRTHALTGCEDNYLRFPAGQRVEDLSPDGSFLRPLDECNNTGSSYREAAALREKLMDWMLSDKGAIPAQYRVIRDDSPERDQSAQQQVLNAMSRHLRG